MKSLHSESKLSTAVFDHTRTVTENLLSECCVIDKQVTTCSTCYVYSNSLICAFLGLWSAEAVNYYHCGKPKKRRLMGEEQFLYRNTFVVLWMGYLVGVSHTV